MKKVILWTVFLVLPLMTKAFYALPQEETLDSFPHLLDTSLFQVQKKQESNHAYTSCDYLYVGKYKDTIAVNYALNLLLEGEEDLGKNGIKGYCLDWILSAPYEFWNKSAIGIQIDTSKRIKNRGWDLEHWTDAYFEAYPVLLRNLEEDTIVIGLALELPLLMEAKDSLGKWQPIEEEVGVVCEMGLEGVILPPNEVVLTSVLIYHGNYATELRLKIGKNYSTPFKGYINYSQFKR